MLLTTQNTLSILDQETQIALKSEGETLSKEIGKRLKVLAAERKLRQTELAARMEMDYGHLNQVLNGHRPVYAEELPRYAEVLGVSLETILGLEEK